MGSKIVKGQKWHLKEEPEVFATILSVEGSGPYARLCYIDCRAPDKHSELFIDNQWVFCEEAWSFKERFYLPII